MRRSAHDGPTKTIPPLHLRIGSFCRLLPIGLTMGFVALTSSSAEVLEVPTDFATIGSAIDASVFTFGPDTVLVLPGTYFEHLTLRDGVLLVSRDGAAVTTIDGSSTGTVIRCQAIHTAAGIRGFTIQNGRAEVGAGVYCNGSAFVLEQNIIRNNETFGTSYGGGVYTTLCPREMIVKDNLIYGNWAHIGAGVCSNGSDFSTVEGNTIWGNSANFASGIISYNESNPVIRNNIIAENEGGKGLYVHSSAQAVIQCNDVWSNTPTNYHAEDMTGVAGNFSRNPLFCDVGALDFELNGSSPCLPGNHPDGSDCGLVGAFDSCSPPFYGACCLEVDECLVTTENLCAAANGFYQPGISCHPNPCPPSGACCLETGECIVTGIAVCEQAGGTLLLGEPCDPSPCVVPFGACCFANGTCLDLAGTECAAQGGMFLGADSACSTESCDPSATSGESAASVLALELPSPNPNLGKASIRFALPERAVIQLEIIAPSGQRVASLIDGELSPGEHQVEWLAPEDLAPGVLILVLRTPTKTLSQKFIHFE